METINARSLFSQATGFIARGGFDWTCNPYVGCSFGCTYCLAPETPILHADLAWRPIGEVQVGDRLVGFDEYPGGGRKRLWRESVVEGVHVSHQPTIRMITQGTEVITTANHGWLRKRRGNWQTTRQLRPGADLKSIGCWDLLPVTEDYRRGYIAGMTLGDGTMRYEPGQRTDKLGFPQAYWRVALIDVDALQRLVEYLSCVGVTAWVRPFETNPPTKTPMQKVEVRSLSQLAIVHQLVNLEVGTSEYRRGFLAGIFDAEGNSGTSLRISQKNNLLRGRVQQYASQEGFRFQEERYGQGCPTLRLTGPRNGRWQFLSWLRPAIARKLSTWEGWEAEGMLDGVETLEPGPVREMIDIRTSTRTFYAAGLATHNCYAMFLPQNRRPREEWGKWLQAKVNALALARKQASKVAGKAVYLSSVTDPYVPAERSLCLTRGILEEMVPYQPRLVVQTRGPLVVRDLDVLTRFRAVRLNVSIPTDSEEVRQAFEPKAPRLERRWQALAEAKAAGLPVGVCVTPMLPLENPRAFVDRLLAFQPDVLVTQDFHEAQTGFGADTGELAREQLQQWRWTREDYQRCVEQLRSQLDLYEAEAGFFPPQES
jgi:DNA repair photolyase